MSDYRNEDTTSWDAGSVRRMSEHDPDRHPPNRRSRHSGSHLQYWMVVLIVSAVLAGCSWLLVNDLCSLNKKSTTATIEISSDDTIGTIASKLHKAGLVNYPWFFTLFEKLDHAEDKIGIGSYKLNSNMDYLALITAMHNASGGLDSDIVQVTIPEGYNVRQIISLMAQKGVNTEAALTEAAKTSNFEYDFIDNTSEELSRLEGYLFPDTYEFYVNEEPSAALSRLMDNFEKKMDGDRMTEVKKSSYSLKQIITIASLIEKETTGSDQSQIAAVIYNRLNDSGSHGTYRMLNVDASLLYVLPDHTGSITSKDKETNSPYNLYRNAGLPPTPIANPGVKAIDAALNPDHTDYYYYALGTDDTHHFFETYQEHQNFLDSSEYAG